MNKVTPTKAFDIVIIGATGDLAARKLLPALYRRDADGQFNSESRIIGLSRANMERDDYIVFAHEALNNFLDENELTTENWEKFSQRLHFFTHDVSKQNDWEKLQTHLRKENDRTHIFYLAVSPKLFGTITTELDKANLIHENTRVVLEKPIGKNLETAKALNNQVGTVFNEEQIFRIDHYLGKETVQNLLALRFGNSLFEPLWKRGNIDHIQISVVEEVGIGSRGMFYNETGALRDMVQNHLLQLLCLVAMEPPANLNHEQIRNEKLKVLKALRPITKDQIKDYTVRGQYRGGAVNDELVPSYIDELDHTHTSNTETFVAIKAHIDNWRWANVPFYLRTGKRLAAKCSEIVIQFSPVAHSIFNHEEQLIANRLTIRLQPDEGIKLSLMVKEPGPSGFRLLSLPLNLSFTQAFETSYPDSYERLLMDVVRGDPALFMRRDEVETAWTWIDNIIEGWKATGMKPDEYIAGSWGPTSSDLLIGRDQRTWHNSIEY